MPVRQRINAITGISGAGARRRESNRIRRSMRNAARRVSNGGNGG